LAKAVQFAIVLGIVDVVIEVELPHFEECGSGKEGIRTRLM
jgi:hypothetical protein